MNGSYALDTTIVIALINGDARIAQLLTATTVFVIPSIVIGELYFGAYKSARVAANVARLEHYLAEDLSSDAIRDVDVTTAQHYGQIKIALRLIGRPIPENDIWIAAIALQHNLTLATRDQHFQHVAGLSIEMW